MSPTTQNRIRIRCRKCQAEIAVPASAAGTRCSCPRCGATLRIASAAPSAISAPSAPETPLHQSPTPAAKPAADVIRLRCEHCGQKLKVPAAAAGKHVKCRKCATVLTVSAPDAVPEPVPEEQEDLFGGLADGQAIDPTPELLASRATAAPSVCSSCGAPTAAGAKICAACADSAYRAAPKAKPKRKKSASALGANLSALFAGIMENRMSRWWVVMILGGGALVYLGVAEMRLNATAKAEPRRITCARLTADGPGDNTHVILSDFLLCDSYVYTQGALSWQGAWVPAVPLGGAYHKKLLAAEGPDGSDAPIPDPDDFKVIISLPNATGPDDLDRVAERGTIQGTIVNAIVKLDRETTDLLIESYPDVDIASCWILVEGRTPGGTSKVWNLLGGGIVLIVLGGVLLVRGGM